MTFPLLSFLVPRVESADSLFHFSFQHRGGGILCTKFPLEIQGFRLDAFQFS